MRDKVVCVDSLWERKVTGEVFKVVEAFYHYSFWINAVNIESGEATGLISKRDFLVIFKEAENKQGFRIGIAGKARVGKDTLANILLPELGKGWSKVSLADPIRDMLAAIGVVFDDSEKAENFKDFGVTPRVMMQTLGTEWGRKLISEDVWLKVLQEKHQGNILVPDVRFENEADFIRENGVLIHLVGYRGGIEGNHSSESGVSFKRGDILIDNSKDLDWLREQVYANDKLKYFLR